MKYSKIMAIGTLAAGMLFSSVASAQDYYRYRDGDNYDYGYRRHLRRDYERVDRLRAAIAADRYRLEEDRRYGRRWAAERDARDLARHEYELQRQLRDSRWDWR